MFFDRAAWRSWLKRAITAVPTSWLRAYLVRREPIIVMYHGVRSNSEPHWLGSEHNHLPLDLFVSQLRVLTSLRKVIPLSAMIEGLRSGANLAGTAAITFDDGYRNNVTTAAPALIDHQLPATFFLTTGFVGTNRCFWTARMAHAVHSLVGRRESILVAGHKIDLGSADRAFVGFMEAKGALKRLSMPQAEAFVHELESAAAEQGLLPPEPEDAVMSWDEARSLASSGFEIGAHTVNHAILSRLPLEQAKAEILQSQQRIQAEIGRCSPAFCYPNGQEEDLTPEVVEFCRSHFQAALSTSFGSARLSELFQLRRVVAPALPGPDAYTWQILRSSAY